MRVKVCGSWRAHWDAVIRENVGYSRYGIFYRRDSDDNITEALSRLILPGR